MIEWILEILFTGMYNQVDVVFSMAWWAPLVASGIGAGINLLSGKGRQKDARASASSSKANSRQALGDLRGSIAGLQETAEGIDTDRSVEDLYGPQIQSMTDRVAADTGGATGEVFRAMMAGGGDLTGQGASLISGLQQQGQRSVSDVINQFTQLADRRNLQAEARKDRLGTTTMQAESGLWQALEGLFQEERGRGDRMRTARTQTSLDILGMGSSLAGQLYGDR